MLLWSTSMFLWGGCSSSSSASSSTSSSSSSSSSAAQQFSSSFSGSERNPKCIYQNWEEPLRVSENNIQDIQRSLRCRVCARWGDMCNVLLTFNILAT